MRRKLERYVVLAFLAASPLWLPSVPERVGSSLRLGLYDLFRPAVLAVDSFQSGLDNVFFGLFQWPYLREENRLLRRQITTLYAHEKTHEQLFEENARLRRLLGLKQESPWKLLPAEVAGREFSVWSRTLMIDKGASSGVRPGMAVISAAGLVGRVSDAGKSFSRVTLLNDPHFRVSGATNPSRVMTLVVGASSGGVLGTYIPLESEVKAGETVVTVGGASFCPEGVPIGMIFSFSEDPSHLYVSARIRPAVDLSSVEEVLVILWPFSDSSPSS